MAAELMRFRRRQKPLIGRPTLLQTLIVVFVLPLLLTGALIEYLAWKHEQDAVEALVWELQDAVGDRIEERVDHLTSDPEAATFRMARALRRGDLDPNELTSWKAYMADQGQFFNDLTFIFFANQSDDFVTLYQRSGQVDQVSFRNGEAPEKVVRHELLPGDDQIFEQITQAFVPTQRPWYQQAVAAERPVWTGPYEFFITSGGQSRQDRLIEATGITFVVPYYAEFGLETDAEADFIMDAAADKTLLGVIGVDFTLEDINYFLNQLDISDGGEAFIMDRTGQVIASSDPADFSQEKSLPLSLEDTDNVLIAQTGAFLQTRFSDFENITNTHALSFEIEGERQLLRVQPYSDPHGLDWLMVVVVPESDFLGPIRKDSRMRWLFSLAVLSVISMLLAAIAQRINRSMSKLSLASQAIADGNLHQSVSGSFIQEINTTAHAFNKMGQKLEVSYAQLKEYSKSLEAKVKERTQSLEQEVRDRTRSEATFRNLVSNIPGTVYRSRYASGTWTVEFMSEFVEDICGYPAEDFVHSKKRVFVNDVVLPEDRADMLSATEAAIQKDEPYVLEYRIQHADGRIRWIYDKGKAVFDETGELAYLDGAFFDITPLKQAERAIQYQGEIDSLLNQVSRSLLEQDLNDATNFALEAVGRFTRSDRTRIFRFDSHSQFCLTHHWSDENSPNYVEARQYIGAGNYIWFYRQLLLGKPLQFLSLDDLPEAAAASHTVLKAHGIQSLLDVPMVYRKQSVGFIALDTVHTAKSWTETEVSVVRLVGEMIAMAQQKQAAEEDLIQAKETAEVANRAKSEFLASMSHELRSPLNAILGFAQIMQRSPHLPDHHQDDVQIINRSGEHLLTLINNVLDMSKIEAGRTTLNPIDFDLHSMLQDVYGMFNLSAEQKQLQLTLDRAANLPRYICADQGKLKQILINLLNNGIKFTTQGSITLSAQPHDQSSQSILQFTVTDTGVGIEPADVETVFEPFTQSQSGRDAQEGTGLGLSICRKFVQMMGGEIHLENRTDGVTGTVATFTIEAQESTTQAVEKSVIERKIIGLASGQPRYRILVVDDKPANRQLLVRLLEPLGLETRTASNGKEAVEVAQRWQPDLIWMDLRMPVMDGVEATRQICQMTQSDVTNAPKSTTPKIVALSATSFVQERSDAIAAGCDAFIAKPFQAADIFDCMAQQLGLRYRYADKLDEPVERTDVERTDQDTPSLEPEALSAIAPQLLTDLEAAVLRLQWNKILQLIEKIAVEDEALAEALSQTVHNFQYDQILEGLPRTTTESNE